MPLSGGVAVVYLGQIAQMCRECADRPAPPPPRTSTELPPRPAARAWTRGSARPLLIGVVGIACMAIAPTLGPDPDIAYAMLAGDAPIAPDDRDPIVAIGAPEAPRIHELSISDDGEDLEWFHPLAGPERILPENPSRRFGADRDGNRSECGGGHCGVDLGDTQGTVVYAAADGFVSRVVRSPDEKGGRYVKLSHPSRFRTYYMHLDEIREDLALDTFVSAGEPIGTVGRSGIQHSSPHLHFAVSRFGGTREVFIDPEPMLSEAELPR